MYTTLYGCSVFYQGAILTDRQNPPKGFPSPDLRIANSILRTTPLVQPFLRRHESGLVLGVVRRVRRGHLPQRSRHAIPPPFPSRPLASQRRKGLANALSARQHSRPGAASVDREGLRLTYGKGGKGEKTKQAGRFH